MTHESRRPFDKLRIPSTVKPSTPNEVEGSKDEIAFHGSWRNVLGFEFSEYLFSQHET
jgi:hypothetical protein